MQYDWLAALTYIGTLTALTMLGRFLAFKVPELQRMRELNNEADKPKLARKSYRDWVKVNGRAGLSLNVFFYLAVLPFCVSFVSLPWWRHLVDIVAILLIFDFMYYLTHRFLFHGKPLRKIHALHHQARTPTYIDSLFVHPVETLIGQGLFQLSIPAVALATGAPLNAFAMAVATQIFANAGTLNHVWVDLPRFPFRWLQFLTTGHAAHHVDMNQGNYCQVSLFFDWLFGTYEKPVVRPAP